MRFAFVLAIVCAIGGVAHAQDAGVSSGSLPNGATLDFRREFLHEVDNPATHPDTGELPGQIAAQPLKLPDSLWTYFNFAHCVCDEPGDAYGNPNNRDRTDQTRFGGKDPHGFEEKFGYEIGYTRGSAPVHIPLHIYTGDDTCSNLLQIGSDCIDETDVTDIDSISTTGTIVPELHVYDLMMPEQALRNPQGLQPEEAAQCSPRTFAGQEWLIADTQNQGMFDFFQSQEIDTDSLPPPQPVDLKAAGAENAIQLTWGTPEGDTSDVYEFQALCVVADNGTTAHTRATDSARYMTPRTLCGVESGDVDYATTDGTSGIITGGGATDTGDAGVGIGQDAGVVLTDAGSTTIVDAGPINVGVPDPIAHSDPAYICGTNTSSTATSMRIQNLTNGQAYYVALLTMDKFGNASGIYVTNPITPQEVTDLWEDLHDRGSKVEGGFCLLSETFGDDSGITNALRGFRDDNLASTAIGRAMIDGYYETLGRLGPVVHGSWALKYVAVMVLQLPILIALVWHLLTLPGLLAVFGALWLLARNRRRILATRAAHSGALRLAATAGAAIVVTAVAPHAAHAQPVPNWDGSDDSLPQGQEPEPEPQATPEQATRPYQDDSRQAQPSRSEYDQSDEPAGPSQPNWIAGARIGPYTPGIDAQLGSKLGGPGPYAQMFGTGIELMPMIDLDRVLWRNDFGEVTAGLSLGFMSRSAHAYLKNSSPEDPNRGRSAGDENSFRLLPVAATASYRLTYFSNNFGVPIVPYIRGGLSYYVWWINAPSGNLAQVCNDGGSEPDCSQNKAAGASLGFQAAIGLSVYAEQIDSNTAKAMHDSGLDHAGFYAELSYANVDGFGDDTKLSVGDATWFAGVTFEF
jgi:hypothetical protein|nr:MXAN_2562 family outer membrane beta-barrel protein [Kofleriaceae bacterium]